MLDIVIDVLHKKVGVKVIIQRFVIKDYAEVYNLWNNTVGMGMRSLDDTQDGISRFLERNPSTNFVVKIDEEIVGAILCGNDGRRGYIYHLAVKESVRKQGIGRSLVDEVVTALKQVGINKAALVVFCDNEIGNGFWERIGFQKRNDLIYRDMSIS